MLTVEGGTPDVQVRASRPRSILAQAAVAVVLCLSLVFVTPTRAQALDATDYVKVGKTLSPGAAVAGTALCATVVGCVVTTAASAALTAYATKDVWLPVVEGGLNWIAHNIFGEGGSTGCTVTIHIELVAHEALWGSTWTCGAPITYRASLQINKWGCRGAGGSVVVGTSPTARGFAETVTGNYTNNGGETSGNRAGVCAVGQTLVFVRGWIDKGHGRSETKMFGSEVANEDLSTMTNVSCQLPDGSFKSIILRGTDSDRVPMPSCQARYPGSIPTSVTIASGYPNAEQTVSTVNLPQRAATLDRYPGCFDSTTGAFLYETCRVRVWVGGKPCAEGVTGCGQWETTLEDDKIEVECRMGSYVIPIAGCDQLRNAYVQGSKTRTLTEVHPKTKELITTEEAVAARAGAQVGTTTQTLPTVGPNPRPGTTAVPGPGGGTDPHSQDCWGSSWSWNPVSWVYTPVKCALMWAFIPKTAFSTRVQTVQTAYSGRMPFSWAQINLPVVSVGQSCPSWRIKVGALDKNIVCDSSYIQALRGSRTWIAIGMTLLAVWPLIRGIWYASIPVLKATPTNNGS